MSNRSSTESRKMDQLLPPLDDRLGPAAPLSTAAQAALIEQALDRSAAIPMQRMRRGLAFGGAAAITSAIIYALFRRWLRTSSNPVSPTKKEAAAGPSPMSDTLAKTVDPGVDSHAAVDRESVSPDTSSTRSTSAKRTSLRSTQDLLRMASERRRQKRFAEALQIYLQIVQQDPSSEESYVAKLAAGGLLLEKKKQPQSALRMFRSALRLRPQGTLTEEARMGICDALALLSDRTAEAQAIREFLAHHSDSPAKGKMEARLRQVTERLAR